MSTDITPEKVAAAACEDVGGWQESLEGALSVTAEGNVLSLEVARWDGPDGAETVRHFRAPVVEGETAPIMLPRLDTSFLGLDFEGEAIDDPEGTGWQVVPYSTVRKWVCEVAKADSVVFRGAPGVVSTAEARRFAAALVAVAAAVDAAQAEQSGGAL